MAYAAAEAAWDGSADRFEITLEPFIVKGIRIHGPTAGTEGWFEDLLDMIDGTVINTLVFDTKDEKGRVSYETEVEGAQGTGAMVYDYDVEALLAMAKERGYYTITRIVTFQDPFWATANPEHAARNTATGGVWTTSNGLAWADPTDREAWEYPLELALEACRLGFDEIQFDYVRFPSDGDISVLGYDVPSTRKAGWRPSPPSSPKPGTASIPRGAWCRPTSSPSSCRRPTTRGSARRSRRSPPPSMP